MADLTKSSAGVTVDAQMRAGFRVELTHGSSGSGLKTDVAKENGGEDRSFSPTDLVSAALVSCALTTMQLIAHRESIPFLAASGRVEKRMAASPRRVGELLLTLEMPAGLSAAHRARLEEVARGCPVARSLHPDLHAPIEFKYPDP